MSLMRRVISVAMILVGLGLVALLAYADAAAPPQCPQGWSAQPSQRQMSGWQCMQKRPASPAPSAADKRRAACKCGVNTGLMRNMPGLECAVCPDQIIR